MKWKEISKYRDELFGLSIMSIIILHYFDGVIVSANANKVLKTVAFVYNGLIGSTGVDIFLFLSGFGIYYSLAKKQNIAIFYGRRLKRVVFPYLIVGGGILDNQGFNHNQTINIKVYI